MIKQFIRIPQPTPSKTFDDLTDRELDVFRLIAGCLSNAEIGRELYICDTTVQTDITHILRKLDLRDRVQAVVLAYETGFSIRTRGRQAIAPSARLAERLPGTSKASRSAPGTCCTNRQQLAGTRWVHQPRHARVDAGTRGKAQKDDLQGKRDRE